MRRQGLYMISKPLNPTTEGLLYCAIGMNHTKPWPIKQLIFLFCSRLAARRSKLIMYISLEPAANGCKSPMLKLHSALSTRPQVLPDRTSSHHWASPRIPLQSSRRPSCPARRPRDLCSRTRRARQRSQPPCSPL